MIKKTNKKSNSKRTTSRSSSTQAKKRNTQAKRPGTVAGARKTGKTTTRVTSNVKRSAPKKETFQNAKAITVSQKSITVVTKDPKSGKEKTQRLDRTAANMRKVGEVLDRRKQKSFSVKF